MASLKKMINSSLRCDGHTPDLTIAQAQAILPKYSKFLRGRVSKLSKHESGGRHSLVRSTDGTVYEMLNSMNRYEQRSLKNQVGFEFEHWIKQTNAHNKLSRTNPMMRSSKVVLGRGAFGVTRIARDISNGKLVCAKKLHTEYALQDSHLKHFDAPIPLILSNTATGRDIKRRLQHSSAATQLLEHTDLLTNRERKRAFLKAIARCKAHGSTTNCTAALDLLPKTFVQNYLSDPATAKRFIISLAELDRSELESLFDFKTRYIFSDLGHRTLNDISDTITIVRYLFEQPVNGDETHHVPRCRAKFQEFFIEHYKKKYQLTFAEVQQTIEEFRDIYNNELFTKGLAKLVLKAVSRLHREELVHLDIKPDNIVFTKNRHGKLVAKLIDLDFVNTDKNTQQKKAYMGCIAYMPPEAFKTLRDNSCTYSGFKGDAYAMGMVLRRLFGYSIMDNFIQKELLDSNPKKRSNVADLYVASQAKLAAKIEHCPGKFTLKDLSDTALHSNPAKRLGIDQQADLLRKSNQAALDPKSILHQYRLIDRFANVLKEPVLSAFVDSVLSEPTNLFELREKNYEFNRLHPSEEAEIDLSARANRRLSTLRKAKRGIKSPFNFVANIDKTQAEKALEYHRKLF